MGNNVTEIYNYTNILNITVSIIMFINCCFGACCNYFIIYIFYKEKKERTSFNLICLFRAASNICILLAIFLLLFIPDCIIGYTVFGPALETVFITTANSIYLVNEYQTVLVAINRFISLFFPFYYSRVCGFKVTFGILTVLHVYRFVRVTTENIRYIPLECYTTFDIEILTWMPNLEERCHSASGIILFVSIIFGLVTLFNICTFIKIVVFYVNGTQNETRENRQKVKKNIWLFLQTVFQDSLFVIDITFTFKLSSLSYSRIWQFISGTLIWQCLHSFDGFIMIMFNERLSFLKAKLWETSIVPTISKHVTSSRNNSRNVSSVLPDIS